MDKFESIADRRIREAREAGYFDNLPGAGKPIADLDQERPAGWWAARTVKLEKDKVRYDELKAEVAAALPALWRLRSEADLGAELGRLNREISAYNAATSFEQMAELDPESTSRKWRELEQYRQASV
ncbi:MAG: DnaJ family domain-containing protein [Acidimicrobiales bacterium]